MLTRQRLRIGLTGGIGSGKSTVAGLLAKLGAAVIDTDAIARSLTLPGGAAMDAIRCAYGADFIDAAGALDRTRMRSLVFSDPSAKRRLEAILHPLIGIETETRAQAAQTANAPVLVFDVPLLAESAHWRTKVDQVLVVDCREQTQIDRVIARSGWALGAAQAVIAQQATRALRRACADAVIFNDGLSLDELSQRVCALAERWFVQPA